MSSEISRFIKNTPTKSLKKYFKGVHSVLVEEVKWDSGEKSIKKSLLDIGERVTGEKLALLNSRSEGAHV